MRSLLRRHGGPEKVKRLFGSASTPRSVFQPFVDSPVYSSWWVTTSRIWWTKKLGIPPGLFFLNREEKQRIHRGAKVRLVRLVLCRGGGWRSLSCLECLLGSLQLHWLEDWIQWLLKSVGALLRQICWGQSLQFLQGQVQALQARVGQLVPKLISWSMPISVHCSCPGLWSMGEEVGAGLGIEYWHASDTSCSSLVLHAFQRSGKA